MSDADLHVTDTEDDVADDATNRRIAALLLAAILLVTLIAIAAGQAFAASNGCGEPAHHAPARDSAFAGRDFAMISDNRNDRRAPVRA